jgi:hypothetical protein
MAKYIPTLTAAADTMIVKITILVTAPLAIEMPNLGNDGTAGIGICLFPITWASFSKMFISSPMLRTSFAKSRSLVW